MSRVGGEAAVELEDQAGPRWNKEGDVAGGRGVEAVAMSEREREPELARVAAARRRRRRRRRLGQAMELLHHDEAPDRVGVVDSRNESWEQCHSE